MDSKVHNCSSSPSESRTQLLQLLEDDRDVMLVFQDGDGKVEEVPGHSLILKQWSQVLADALSAENSGSSSNNSSTREIRIPMPDTKKDDWLLAMEYLYPVTPRGEVTVDNLKMLLSLGEKYGMPALQQQVGSILVHRRSDLSLGPSSSNFVWKWVLLADRYALYVAAQACIDSKPHPAALMEVCPANALSQLSEVTLCHLASVMEPWLVKPGQVYCSKCVSMSKWNCNVHCERCGHAMRM